nr:hypothetical protein L204_03427 [Cryptococcus depauperatus CBS 7855]
MQRYRREVATVVHLDENAMVDACVGCTTDWVVGGCLERARGERRLAGWQTIDGQPVASVLVPEPTLLVEAAMRGVVCDTVLWFSITHPVNPSHSSQRLLSYLPSAVAGPDRIKATSLGRGREGHPRGSESTIGRE